MYCVCVPQDIPQKFFQNSIDLGRTINNTVKIKSKKLFRIWSDCFSSQSGNKITKTHTSYILSQYHVPKKKKKIGHFISVPSLIFHTYPTSKSRNQLWFEYQANKNEIPTELNYPFRPCHLVSSPYMPDALWYVIRTLCVRPSCEIVQNEMSLHIQPRIPRSQFHYDLRCKISP